MTYCFPILLLFYYRKKLINKEINIYLISKTLQGGDLSEQIRLQIKK